MTQDCGASELITWNKATSYNIEADSRCLITITVTNQDCKPADYYVGGNLVASNIQPNGGKMTFEIMPGEYEVYATDVGVSNSPDQISEVAITVSFTESGERTISGRESCP